MKLVLWDIDHTLIETRGVGREIFGEAFELATGLPMREQAAVDGMTEQTIFRETARLHGIDSDLEMFQAFARASARLHQQRTAELRDRGRALPGAQAALEAFASNPAVVQTVVTGNIRAAAETKLNAFGLGAHIRWSYGGYGEDHEERSELVRISVHRAAHGLRSPIALAQVLLIGDTPADVSAGLVIGVRVAAVASGRSSTAQLREAGAQFVFSDLTGIGALQQLITEA